MIDAAIILAGGKGSRLAPWPAPKAILPVWGQPIIDRLIEHVAPHVNRVIVCVGYRAGDVAVALRHRSIFYSDAGEDATMVERLLKAKKEHNVTKRALILYGDHLADVDIAKLEAHHDEAGCDATFTAHDYKLPFGLVRGGVILNNERVLVNIGFAVIDPLAWARAIPQDGLAEWLNNIGSSSFVHEGRSTSINNHAEHAEAEKVWR